MRKSSVRRSAPWRDSLSARRGRFAKDRREVGEAGQVVDRKEAIDEGQQRAHAAGARLEVLESEQRIEPDDLAREQAQLRGGARQLAVLVAIEAVGDEKQRRVGAEQAPRPVAVEVIEAR